MISIEKDLVKSISTYATGRSNSAEELQVATENIAITAKHGQQVDDQVVHEMVAKLNDMFKTQSVSFSFNNKVNRVIIKIYDGETNEIIKEFPSKEIMSLYEHIQENMGLIVDESR